LQVTNTLTGDAFLLSLQSGVEKLLAKLAFNSLLLDHSSQLGVFDHTVTATSHC